MSQAEWEATTDPLCLMALLPAPRSDRKCRLVASSLRRAELWAPDRTGCNDILHVAERLADGVATADELARAIAQSERGLAEASNGWSYLAGATAATLHPIAIEAAGLVLEHLESYQYELFSRYDAPLYAALIRDIFGNPFRPVAFDPFWRTEAVVGLAAGIYADRAFDRLPVLADALDDAGCADPDLLAHCREPGPHVRGCWVVDLVLGKA